MKNTWILLQGLRAKLLQRSAARREQAGLAVVLCTFFCCDFRQLVRAGFTDEHGNFVIGWLAAMLRSESLDRGVTLCASYAIFFEQLVDTPRISNP